jgi:hypothetical protein
MEPGAVDRSAVNYPRAATAGLVSGAAVEIVAAALRRFGIPLDIERMIGMLFAPDKAATFGGGMVVFLALTAIAGLVYARLMARRHRRDWWAAMPIAAVNTIVSGVLTALAPTAHPRVPTQIESPGPFLVAGGVWSVVAFVALHAMFGAMFGALYTYERPDRVFA